MHRVPGFSLLGKDEGSPPTSQKFAHPPTWKNPPIDSPPPNCPPPKVNSLHKITISMLCITL